MFCLDALIADGEFIFAAHDGALMEGGDACLLPVFDLSIGVAFEEFVFEFLKSGPVGFWSGLDAPTAEMARHGDGFGIADEILFRLATTQSASASIGTFIDDSGPESGFSVGGVDEVGVVLGGVFFRCRT